MSYPDLSNRRRRQKPMSTKVCTHCRHRCIIMGLLDLAHSFSVAKVPDSNAPAFITCGHLQRTLYRKTRVSKVTAYVRGVSCDVKHDTTELAHGRNRMFLRLAEQRERGGRRRRRRRRGGEAASHRVMSTQICEASNSNVVCAANCANVLTSSLLQHLVVDNTYVRERMSKTRALIAHVFVQPSFLFVCGEGACPCRKQIQMKKTGKNHVICCTPFGREFYKVSLSMLGHHRKRS